MGDKHFERIGNNVDAFAAETEDMVDMANKLVHAAEGEAERMAC